MDCDEGEGDGDGFCLYLGLKLPRVAMFQWDLELEKP